MRVKGFCCSLVLGVGCACVQVEGGAPLRFTSVTDGQIVSGNLSLAVSAPPGTRLVQYSMGSHLIGQAIAPGFLTVWNSAEAMDGVSGIQAIAQDAAGRNIGSGEVLVQVSNRQASLVVDSPDLRQTLSGIVRIAVTGADQLAFPAVWTLNIDGEEQSTVWTDNSWQSPITVTFALDTSRFGNGTHELHISLNSRSGPQSPQWVNWRAMVNRVVQFQNGRTPMEIVSTFQNVYLSPRESLALGCRLLYTNGSEEPCSTPAYTAADPSVVRVDKTGLLTGLGTGFSRVNVQSAGYSTCVNVWVMNDTRVPHFTGDGQFRRGYDATASFLPISPFFLDPALVQQDQSLLDAARAAGVNTLSHGLYPNPRNLQATFSSWKESFDTLIAPKLAYARNNGFHLLLTGDDIARQIGSDAWFSLNWPASSEAVNYAAGALAATGVGIGVEVIDEASMMWGPRPVPAGRVGQKGSFSRVNCNSGSCSAVWPNNGLPVGRTFAFQNSTRGQLDTPPGSVLFVKASNENGFSFDLQSPVSGMFNSVSDPNLSFLAFAGNYCSGLPCIPQVPNDALAQVRGWLTSRNPHTPISWPALASDPPAVHGAWIGRGSLSDYASHYFTSLKGRTTYPWSEGIQEMASSMHRQFLDRQPWMMLDRPQLMLVSLAGPSYTKQSSGTAIYVAGADTLDQPGVGPSNVSAVMMSALALGGVGLRLYYFEPASNWVNRAQAPSGTHLQTGTNPTNLNPASWAAMSVASNFAGGVMAPFLLGQYRNSPAFGKNILTAAREGSAGRMLLVVNDNDWGRTVRVDLSQYSFGNGAIRYLISASGTSSLALGEVQQDAVTMQAGQSAVYLFTRDLAARSRKSRED